MHTRTLPLSLLALAVIGAVLSGCSRKQPEQTSAEPAAPHVALIMKSLSNEFFKTMEEGAKAHQQAHAAEYRLTVNGIKDELDVSKQVELVERAVAQKVDAIVIAPADSKALVNACRKAVDAGIPVVNIDNKLDADALRDAKLNIPFVGPNNRDGARAVAEVLAAKLPAGAAVAILEGAPNAYNGIQRKLGFEDAMRAAGATVVTSQTAYWETDKAYDLARNILTAHPQLSALLCANDSMALGAVRAVEDMGRKGKVFVVGFDNIQAVNALVQSGAILATADQHADQLAVYGIEYALEIIRAGKPLPDKETPVDVITAGTR